MSPQAGMSQVYKLVNQGLIFSTVVVTVEAVAAGVKAGADPALLIEFLNGALGRNFVTAQTFPNTILPGKFGRFGKKAELPAAALLYEEWAGIEMRNREQT